jgi:hypothetical protein
MALTPEEELELLELEEAEYQASKANRKTAETPKVSKLESGLRGAAQGATLGYSDEIVGGAEAAYRKLTGDTRPLSEIYETARNESRLANKEAQEANPGIYTTGGIGGSLATMLIPGVNVAKGASIGRAALQGAGIGGVAGAGASDEELASMEALKDIASGAALGGAFGAAGQAIGKAVGAQSADEIASGLKGKAEEQAARALGAERGTIKKLGMDKVRQIGRYGIDEGIVSPLASTDDLISRNTGSMQKAGSEMNKVFSQIDEAGASTFNPKVAAKRMSDELGDFYRDPINKGETAQFDNIIESILNRGPNDMPIKEAQLLKEKIGKVANWKNNIAPTDKERMARDAYKLINNYLDESVDVSADIMNSPRFTEQLKQARKTYSAGKGAEELLTNKQAREQGNKMFGLTDSIIAGGGIAASPATGGLSLAPAAFVGAKKLAEKYGSQTMAIGFDKLGDIVKNNGQFLGKFQNVLQNAAQRGGNALGASHYLLYQQNPEYREMLNKMKEENE